jgi:hypothetical protein
MRRTIRAEMPGMLRSVEDRSNGDGQVLLGTFSGYGAALPYDEKYAAKPAYTGLSNGINANA